jgi:VanZ family protein
MFWSMLGWLLVVVVVMSSLLPGAAIPMDDYDKFLHAGSYCVLMVWFAGVYTRRRYSIIAVTLIALGVMLDAMQAGIATRQFDLADILANVVGVGIGLALSVWILGGWCQWIERLFIK